MNAPHIQFAIDGNCLYLKVAGVLRHNGASTLESFVSSVFNQTPLDMAVIDLIETEFIDSTNLGILASIAIKLNKTCHHKPLIVTGSEDITLLLNGMGFDHYFEIVDESAGPEAPPYCGIDLANRTPATLEGITLQAHKNLAEMNTKNREAFKDVIELLEKETSQNTTS